MAPRSQGKAVTPTVRRQWSGGQIAVADQGRRGSNEASRLQAVILAAGRGERLRPITDYVPKPLIPFWGKPFISYLLDNLKGLVDEVVVVVAEGEEIRERLGDSYGSIALSYVRQERPLGTGDALMQTRGMFDEPFLTLLADTCPPRDTIAEIIEAPGDAALTVIKVADPHNHLGVTISDESVVEELWTDSSLVDAGMFRFSAHICESLDGVPPQGGELRVLQGVDRLIKMGADVRAVQMQPPWLQFGDHEGLSGVIRVMRQLRPSNDAASTGASDSSVEITSRACQIQNSLVFGPGELLDCTINDSLVYCARRIVGETVSREIVAWP